MNTTPRAIPEKCDAVFGQELRKNKELEQMERSKNRDFCSRYLLIYAQVRFTVSWARMVPENQRCLKFSAA